jgi:hypothetical protein
MSKEIEEKGIEVKDIKEAQEKIAELQKDSSVNKPTEDEINEAVKIFNEQAADFNSKLFEIGTPEKAEEIYDFMLEFLEKYVYWTKQGWMGVLRMDEELKIRKKERKEGDPFEVGYQALEFMFYMLTNPGGTGLKTAKAIDKVKELYGEILDSTGKKLEEARAQLKEIQFLQDKVTAMQQGFYLEREDGVAEEEDQDFPSPTTEDLLNKKDK